MLASGRSVRVTSSRALVAPRIFRPTYEQMVADDPDLQAFQFELLLEARRTQELLPTVAGLYEEYREATRRELVRMGLPDDGTLAHAVFAMCDGLVLQQVVFGDDQPTEAGAEVAADHAAFTRRGEPVGHQTGRLTSRERRDCPFIAV